jgi:hypothetical protein
MLICRPRPEADPQPPQGPPMTLKETVEHELAVQALQTPTARRRKLTEEDHRISVQSGEWERQEVQRAYAHNEGPNATTQGEQTP